MAHGDGQRAPRASSSVDGTGEKRVSVAAIASEAGPAGRADRRRVGEAIVSSQTHPGLLVSEQAGGRAFSKATTAGRRGSGSDGPQRPTGAVGGSPCGVARRDLIKREKAWRRSDAASEQQNAVTRRE